MSHFKSLSHLSILIINVLSFWAFFEWKISEILGKDIDNSKGNEF